MTVLVFNSHGRTLVRDGWTVSAKAKNSAQIVIHAAETDPDCAINGVTLDEFLALLAEGGKIVDVRHLQEPK